MCNKGARDPRQPPSGSSASARLDGLGGGGWRGGGGGGGGGSTRGSVGPEGRWLHYGLTSSDVVDTALAMLMRDACDLVRTGLVELMEAVRERAFRHKHAAMIGRTHGVHAEPMPFGLQMALWHPE